MIKIKPKFDFEKYNFGVGFILNREYESKKYIRHCKVVNYIFGFYLLWFSFGILIEYTGKREVKNNE